MFFVLFAVLILLPIAELWLLIQVGSQIGALPTIAMVVLIALIGAWLLRRQSLAALLKADSALRAGRMPVEAVADGAGLMVAALLIMMPGLITSAIGALMLVPPIRQWLAKWAMRRWLANAITIGPGAFKPGSGSNRQGPFSQRSPRDDLGGPVIDGEFEPVADDPAAEPAVAAERGKRQSPWSKRR